MKGRTILTVVTAFGFLAWSVVVAQAGAGSGSLGDASFFQCYHIEGSDPPHVLNVDDQFIDAPGQSVKVGKAKLLCTPASAEVTSGHTTQLSGFEAADHLKCYERPSAGNAPGLPVQLVDPFGNEVVSVLQPKYVCVGAFKCNPPAGEGQTCP
jgi:hypothetical protein